MHFHDKPSGAIQKNTCQERDRLSLWILLSSIVVLSENFMSVVPDYCTQCHKNSRSIYYSTQKKPHPFLNWWKKNSVKVVLKILKFSFISDQSQICIKNGLGARGYQSYLLICKNAQFSVGMQTKKKNNVSAISDAISKEIKLELIDRSQMKDLFKCFLSI